VSAGSLQRRVVFYGWEDIEGMPAFEHIRSADAVTNLPPTAWAYAEDDFVTGCLVDRQGSDEEPTCVRFFRLRSGDELPHILRDRLPTPLELEQDEAITDWTHVVIWPDSFAAHDSRRDAPGLNRLATYFRERANQRVRFFPLYDRSLIDLLEGLDEIKAVELKIQLSRAEQLEQAGQGGLFAGLIDVGREADAAVISTRISVGMSRRNFLSPSVRQEVLGLAQNAEEFLDSLQITGIREGHTVYIDLLRRRLDSTQSVRRSRQLGNAPDPDVMYDAIIQARRELEAANRLQRAVRLR
jgi:hypothetical protein